MEGSYISRDYKILEIIGNQKHGRVCLVINLATNNKYSDF